VSLEILQAIQRLADLGNQQFRGRHLFGGSNTTEMPFIVTDQFVRYTGNENELASYADIDLPLVTNLTGQEAFGGISAEVQSTVDFQPILTAQTRLDDLRGGDGISAGSIVVSDGTSTSTIDISSAETVGDIVRLIESNPPAGRSMTVRVSHDGLDVYIDEAGGGNLSIREVGGGTTAGELGIRREVGAGTAPVIGEDLQRRLTGTTLLDNVLGVRAQARIASAGLNNDLEFEVNERGADLNGIAIQFVDDDLLQAAPGLTQGNETVAYSDTPVAARASIALPGADNDLILTATLPGAARNNVAIEVTATDLGGDTANVSFTEIGGVWTLAIEIDDDQTTLQTLVDEINTEGTFMASADPSAGEGYDAAATIPLIGPPGISTTTGNSGGDARTIFIHVANGQTTANDVVDAVNADPVVSQLVTARLDEKDSTNSYSRGLGSVEIGEPVYTQGGDGVELDQDSGLRIVNAGTTHVIDIRAATTIEDLLNILNGSGADVLAEINEQGTSINVRSRLSGADFHIGENGGTTATDLGIRSFNRQTLLSELNHGHGVNAADGTDFTVIRDDGVELAIDVSSASTVGDVIDLINDHPANAAGSRVVAQLATNGNGIQLTNEPPLATGGLVVRQEFGSQAAWDLGLLDRSEDESSPTDVLVSADVNPQETQGVFNSLLRLQQAVVDNDLGEMERLVAMLDDDLERLSYVRAELGTREQNVDLLQRRLEDDVIQLKSVLSQEIDADLVEVVPRLTALQTIYQASLKTIGQTFRLSLLDYV
jgi:flagellin-like hook-associated protein FlgL